MPPVKSVVHKGLLLCEHVGDQLASGQRDAAPFFASQRREGEMKRLILGALSVVVASGIYTTALAQDMKPRLHTEILGIGSVLGGDDFQDTDLGFGGMLLAGPKIGDFSLLGSGTYRRFGLENSEDDVDVIGVGVAPRYTIPVRNDIVRPWVGASGSILFQTTRTEAVDDPSATGFEVGGAAGVGFQLSEQVVLNTCANLGYMQFGDVDVGDQTIPNSDTSGVGFTFGLGLTIIP